MCGIAGLIHFDSNKSCSESSLVAMRDVITHRGPDDKGIFLDGNVGLAHRRLSIIDISSGHQPMTTENGQFVLVFNGEIYNHRELRRELEQKGSKFRTNSDTEVILEMYRVYGSDSVARLNGIFSIAVWNKQTKTLFIARDHMGVKPLYYYIDNKVLIFASEVKALFESGLVKAECNTDAVPEFFMFRHVAGERTLFKNVHALLPGHHMTLENNKLSFAKYWDPLSISQEYTKSDLSFDDALHQFEELFTDAVTKQMMSDVPLGTFCSGGIDSSLVTAIAAQNSDKAINTFSVGFHEAAYDETKYARMVSERYKTNHHELRIDEQQFTDYLPKMVWYNDEPLNFANSVHIYAISKLAKEHVTVVLTGEGADELLGGYPRYQIPRFVAKLQKLPKPIRSLASSMMGLFKDHRIAKLRSYLGTPLRDSILYNCSQAGLQSFKQYWPDVNESMFQFRADLLDRISDGKNQATNVAKLDQNSYLVSILNRQDKMSMAASLESRVPFLDPRVVEYANSLPGSYKIKGMKNKYILTKIAEKYLPHEVIYRRKSGFGVPLPEWLAADGGLGQLAQDLLSNTELPELESHVNVGNILTEHRNRTADHSEFLWTAMNFILWKKAFSIA